MNLNSEIQRYNLDIKILYISIKIGRINTHYTSFRLNNYFIVSLIVLHLKTNTQTITDFITKSNYLIR
jgi:hypothetical protein